MQDTQSAKQQAVDKIKQSTTILVTVSNNPSVDSLSAALGLSLMLNKLDKHVTTVFSGAVPPAISFLEPNKTFANNVDSLRDFIIALDKEKADRLRYKVEDDVVRIFITPYKTTITQNDLQFSQGDFNVDLIIALGVEKREELDAAITAHGRILHDAMVITINAGDQKSSLGAIDWHDSRASSLSELLFALSDDLKPKLLDQQISTALLTGLVAATNRFSNEKTDAQVMNVAAQLMAAGANQQLIAAKLESISPSQPVKVPEAPVNIPQPKEQEERPDLGDMHIQHEDEAQKDTLPEQAASISTEPVIQEPTPQQPPRKEESVMSEGGNKKLNAVKNSIKNNSNKKIDESKLAPGSASVNGSDEQRETPSQSDDEGYLSSHSSWQGRNIEPPSMGGVLNATTEQAMQDEQRAQDDDRNKMILTHGEVSAPQDTLPPVQPMAELVPAPPAPEPLGQTQPLEVAPHPAPEPAPVSEPPKEDASAPVMQYEELPSTPQQIAPEANNQGAEEKEPTLEELEQAARAHAAEAAQETTEPANELEVARNEVNNVIEAQPYNPLEDRREDVGTQSFPPLEHSDTNVSPAEPSAAPAILPPPVPPMPDFSTLPPVPDLSAMPPQQAPVESPLPSPAPEQIPTQSPQSAPPAAEAPNPGQYQIPQ